MMLDWKKTLIKPDESLENAIKKLNKGTRILLVVNSSNELLGTLTDGDIRRALIKKLGLYSKVSEVMNTSPMTTKSPYSREKILQEMSKKDILHMPIISNDGSLCGLETLQNLIDKPSYDNPVFLMAGGFGTRLHPLTKDIPKPLLKVGGVPLLETIITQFKSAGFSNFFISLYFKSEMIKEYFGDGSSFGVNIQYVQENKPLGTAGSLGLLPDDMPDLPIIIMNGDLLTKVDFEHLLHFHNNQNTVATMCVREYDLQIPYGVVNVDNYYITSIKEKPFHQFFVNAGIYVLNSQLIKTLDGKTYIDMPDLLHNELEKKQVAAFPVHEYWLDIGHKNEFEKANIDILGL
jgi:dTDP-glucose pyrophosphorylase